MSWPLIIPHSDGGGQIDAVGEGVTDRFGERVYIVQVAKQRGARVIATVSNPRKADHALLGGADNTIDYRNESVGRRIKAMTDGGVDVLFEMDLAANAHMYPEVLKPYGTLVVYGMSARHATLPAHWMMRNAITMRPFLIYDISDADRQDGVRELSALLLAGSLKHTIAYCLPLERIADAHILGEQGIAVGNIVLIPPS